MDLRTDMEEPKQRRTVGSRRRRSLGVLAAGLLGLGALIAVQPAGAVGRSEASGSAPVIAGYKVVTVKHTAFASAVSTATATCPASKNVIGGGASGSAIGAFENIKNSYPSSPTTWTAAVTNTDSVNGTFVVYAVCATVSGAYGSVFSQALDNPSGFQTGAGATCPTTTSALGGGGYNTSNQLLVDINTEGPQTDGVGFSSYTNNDDTADNVTQAVAVCMTTPQGYEVVTGNTIVLDAGGQSEATASCPTGTVVTGGGALDSGTPVTVDLNASYPGNKTTWDAYENNNSPTNVTMTGYAICATP